VQINYPEKNGNVKVVDQYQNKTNYMKTSKLRDLIKETIKENFDDRLKAKMGMSDDEFEKNVTSRDIETPFPGTDKVSNGYKAAKALIDELRYVTYKKLSDADMDDFSVEIINHLLDNTAAQAAAKVFFGKRGL
jgi:hypothetical protein